MRGKNIRIICPQHQERMLRDVIEGYPEEVGHDIIQKAKKYGSEIPLHLAMVKTGKEPYFDANRNNAIVINY